MDPIRDYLELAGMSVSAGADGPAQVFSVSSPSFTGPLAVAHGTLLTVAGEQARAWNDLWHSWCYAYRVDRETRLYVPVEIHPPVRMSFRVFLPGQPMPDTGWRHDPHS